MSWTMNGPHGNASPRHLAADGRYSPRVGTLCRPGKPTKTAQITTNVRTVTCKRCQQRLHAIAESMTR